MLIPFFKMHAQGNDFVFLDAFAHDFRQIDFPKLALDVCQAHFGIGADGLVVISRSEKHDGKMEIFNSDGSRAEMCGSALRCVTLFLHMQSGKGELSIETDSGMKQGIVVTQGLQKIVEVNIGKASLIEDQISVQGQQGSLVSVGNLHYVVYTEDLTTDPHLQYGYAIEHDPHFPQTVNVQYAQKIDSGKIVLKIWENACGPTLACGTGACSAVSVGRRDHGLSNRVIVSMPGGEVEIRYDATSDCYWLCGEVTETFRGEYVWKI